VAQGKNIRNAAEGKGDNVMDTIKKESKGLIPAVTIRIEADYYPEKLDMVGYFCPNPKCSCKDATLYFYEANNHFDKKLFRITLNYKTWKLKSTEIYSNEADFSKVIHEFMTESSDEVKELIRSGKEKAVSEDVLLDDIDYSKFTRGSLVGYSEVYDSPQYQQFLFSFENSLFLVSDQYCPDPKCNCRDVLLLFHIIEEGRTFNAPVLVLRLKFKSKRFSIEPGSGNVSKQYAEQLYQAFLNSLGIKGVGLLEERYFRIKKWGKECLQDKLNGFPKPNVPRTLSGPKIGRNDPCPCGSGKKYKHCCLNKKVGQA